ncbi:putative gntr family transcriptional regulator [Bacillus sp. OxB-1]|uniref:GntR family transcriptional regulator n=1 Tax=Bacillus sp. (strain OxB-1) TaxID=98228 RepID=UPI000581FC32|nr:GntR family transcriptional regulator [Bacillus sp. OxB-1]BAQ11633.1 putative gntr family transcriptional regulator [Bacillus sp. OxB-1]
MKSIKTYSLSEQVFDFLKDSIIRGELKPGDRILELEVAKTYNVSQAPVREALSRLKQEGFVVHYPHKGTFVSNLSKKNIDEIYSFRKAIEPLAIERAIKNIKDEDIKKLRNLYQQMLKAGEKNDFEGLNEIDIKFHNYIYKIADHKLLYEVWESVSSISNRIWYLTSQVYFDKLDEVAQSHLPILEALEERDVDKCIQAFKKHIQHVWDKIKHEDNFN